MPLKDLFVPLLSLRQQQTYVPGKNTCVFLFLEFKGSGHTILVRPTMEAYLQVLHPFDAVAVGLIHKFSLYCW